MEKYLLETCTWIECFHERNGVPEHARAAGRKNLCASEVTLAELTYGAINSDDYERHVQVFVADCFVYVAFAREYICARDNVIAPPAPSLIIR